MKRRDVMKLGAVAAGAGIGVPGCAVPRLVSSMSGPEGAAHFNAMLDQQLATMARPGLLQHLIGARSASERSPEVETKLAEKDALFRRMLGTLLVTQGFRELPVETQLDPAVQARMWSHMDDIGATVFEVTDTLAALDETHRARLRTVLEREPDLPMDLGELIDARAASAGISSGSRRQLRRMMSQSAFRMRHGDPSSIIDEYVDKVARVTESTERHGDALHLSKQLGERSFWRYQHLLAQDGGQPGSPQPPPIGPPTAPPPQPPPAAQPLPAAQPPPAAGQPTLDALLQSARASAMRGDCKTVEALRQHVLSLDRAYHDAYFATNPLIANCREALTVPPPTTAPLGTTGPVESKRRPGSTGLRVGGYMLGIGVVVFGVSLLLVGSSEVFLVGLTVGALLFAIGLVTVIISALIMAAN
jgi:hypothetical protein